MRKRRQPSSGDEAVVAAGRGRMGSTGKIK
jgi:hypothetical protein